MVGPDSGRIIRPAISTALAPLMRTMPRAAPPGALAIAQMVSSRLPYMGADACSRSRRLGPWASEREDSYGTIAARRYLFFRDLGGRLCCGLPLAPGFALGAAGGRLLALAAAPVASPPGAVAFGSNFRSAIPHRLEAMKYRHKPLATL